MYQFNFFSILGEQTTKTPSSSSIGLTVRRIRAFSILRLLLWIAAVGSFLIIVYQLKVRVGLSEGIGHLFWAADWHLILLFQLLLLSLPWRTVSLRMVVFSFFLGVGPVSFLALIITPFVNDLMSKSGVSEFLASAWLTNSAIGLSFWAAIIEEVLKVLPVILLFLWRRTGLRTQSSPLDLAILAAACGAGFGFAEDVHIVGFPSWKFRESIGPGPYFDIPFSLFSLSIFYQIVYHWFFYRLTSFSLGPFSLFPEIVKGNPVVFLGHGTYPLFFGLTLGLALYGARRFKSRWFYLLPMLALLWNIWEHIAANWFAWQPLNLFNVFAILDLHGRILPFVLIFGWIVATVISHRILRQHRDLDIALSWRDLRYAAYKSSGLLGPFAFLTDLLTYLRLRRKTAYGLFHFQNSSDKDQQRQTPSLLASKAQAYLLALRLRGKPLPEVPPEISQPLDWATPVA